MGLEEGFLRRDRLDSVESPIAQRDGAGNPKSEIRPAATARQRGENKSKKMEISKMEKEGLGNCFAGCERSGLLQYKGHKR